MKMVCGRTFKPGANLPMKIAACLLLITTNRVSIKYPASPAYQLYKDFRHILEKILSGTI